MKNYDLVVIGTGVGGTAAAFKCRKAGLSVAVIDKRTYGGTCALRGCDPKKVLVGATEIIDRATRMKSLGIEGDVKINWQDLMNYKKTFTENVPKNREEGYLEAGIDIYHGAASFKSEKEILVNDTIINFKHIVLAVGAKAMPLGIKGDEHLYTSDDFLELTNLPEKIVFIGGGFISFEFAFIAALSGSEVHILNRSDSVLKMFDHELAAILLKRSDELGIKIHFNNKPSEIKKVDGKYLIYAEENGEEVTISCDRVFNGAGRVPDLDDLNLEKGNVKASRHGIVVNEYLQSTSNVRVYSAGDASGSPGLPLTPIAGKESGAVATNILKGNQRVVDYSVMPTVLFTHPKLANLGLTEEQAIEKGYDISSNKIDMKDWYTYKRTNEAYAMIKTIVDKKTNKLLGVSILGSNADELINYFALIVKFDLSYREVKDVLFAYPTSASDLGYFI
jgi:glutathione reductase (NADPH)